MANSTSNLDLIIQSQSSKEVTANALADAGSPATIFGRRQSTSSGLTWGYYGGFVSVDGVLTSIANSTLLLTAITTCYVEADRAGAVSFNTVGYTAGRYSIYTVVTGASTVSSYTDHRRASRRATGRLALAMTDANTTFSAPQARNNILELTGTLTVQRNIVLPLSAQQWTVFNNTAGGFGLQFIGATGTGVIVASAKHAIIYSNGTNVVRVTADV